MRFIDQIQSAIQKNHSHLCVGLDPDISRIPGGVSGVVPFLRDVIDQTHDLVCAYKPQIAYFSAYGWEKDIETIISYIHGRYPEIPVILDAKRGDIGSTADQYAREAFVRYEADALTVSPYMGGDTIEPYFAYPEKGIIVLCKTSNPWSSDFENLRLENGRYLYEEVALRSTREWNQHQQICLVVGATYPEELARVRTIVGDDVFFLIPGVWAQGADIESVVIHAKNSRWSGIIINSARAILYPKNGTPRDEAMRTRDAIVRYL